MRRKPSTLKTNLRRAALPAVGLTLMALVVAATVVGPTGLLSLGDYQRQLAKRERDFRAIDHQREVLRNKVALLDPRHANPDLVDELVRRKLNVAHPDEVIVPLR